VSFKYVINICFFINAIKKICEKLMILKHAFITCQGTHVNLRYGLICMKFPTNQFIKNFCPIRIDFIMNLIL
jgi:coenzyme F420-reducing hydrogenase beta subunit